MRRVGRRGGGRGGRGEGLRAGEVFAKDLQTCSVLGRPRRVALVVIDDKLILHGAQRLGDGADAEQPARTRTTRVRSITFCKWGGQAGSRILTVCLDFLNVLVSTTFVKLDHSPEP